MKLFAGSFLVACVLFGNSYAAPTLLDDDCDTTAGSYQHGFSSSGSAQIKHALPLTSISGSHVRDTFEHLKNEAHQFVNKQKDTLDIGGTGVIGLSKNDALLKLEHGSAFGHSGGFGSGSFGGSSSFQSGSSFKQQSGSAGGAYFNGGSSAGISGFDSSNGHLSGGTVVKEYFESPQISQIVSEKKEEHFKEIKKTSSSGFQPAPFVETGYNQNAEYVKHKEMSAGSYGFDHETPKPIKLQYDQHGQQSHNNVFETYNPSNQLTVGVVELSPGVQSSSSSFQSSSSQIGGVQQVPSYTVVKYPNVEKMKIHIQESDAHKYNAIPSIKKVTITQPSGTQSFSSSYDYGTSGSVGNTQVLHAVPETNRYESSHKEHQYVEKVNAPLSPQVFDHSITKVVGSEGVSSNSIATPQIYESSNFQKEFSKSQSVSGGSSYGYGSSVAGSGIGASNTNIETFGTPQLIIPGGSSSVSSSQSSSSYSSGSSGGYNVGTGGINSSIGGYSSSSNLLDGKVHGLCPENCGHIAGVGLGLGGKKSFGLASSFSASSASVNGKTVEDHREASGMVNDNGNIDRFHIKSD